jgi:hypothetical protein
MSNGDELSIVLRNLKQLVIKEQDVEKLRQFVLDIDEILDLIEARLSQLEEGE